MNRRKIIQSISSACSAAGVPHAGEFAVYGSERKPTLAVIHSAVVLKPEQVESIRECWNHLRKASPGLPPCVVLDRGLTLEMHETDKLVERAKAVLKNMRKRRQERCTLTAEEREAIHRAEARLRTAYVPDDETAATLRELLKRLA